MHFKSTLASVAVLLSSVSADSAGYVLPSSGSASTTQFYLGPELSGGTACGMSALPNGKSTSGRQGGGPGYLYAAINQLAFGANPSAGAGGPGGACGVCYWLTPVSAAGVALSANALIFKIIDECPASVALSGGTSCKACTTSETNQYGKTWHFDIAIDAMSTAQYNQFFNGVTDGSNWKTVYFSETSCGSSNPTPPIKAGVASVDARIMMLQVFAQVLGSRKNSAKNRRFKACYDSGAVAVPHGQKLGETLSEVLRFVFTLD